MGKRAVLPRQPPVNKQLIRIATRKHARNRKVKPLRVGVGSEQWTPDPNPYIRKGDVCRKGEMFRDVQWKRRLEMAITKVERGGRFDLMESFVRKASVNDNLLAKLVDKLVPNKSEGVLDREEIEKVLQTIVGVIEKYVKDGDVLRKILEKLNDCI
jgi:hypothetical protein